MVKERDMTWGGEHTTIQYTHDVLQNCTPETYIILLTNVTPINSMKMKKRKNCLIFNGENLIHQTKGKICSGKEPLMT